MKKLTIILLVSLVFISTLGYFGIKAYREHDRKEIIRVVKSWGKLADFPSDANITLIEKDGSAFTREFRVKFTASEKSIREWLKASDGIQNATLKIEGATENYTVHVTPGGAQYSGVIYYTDLNEVYIRVYWS